MDWESLRDLTFKTRAMREIGIALVSASVVLALFVFLPVTFDAPEANPVTVTNVNDRPKVIPNAFAQVPLHAKAAIVYDLATGETLYAKNADAQLPLASLTKLLAVYAALDSLSPSTPVAISSTATEVEYPKAFSEGQVLALGDLSRLTLTASLNDGAAAIIEAVAEQKQVSQGEALGQAASSLNLSQTYALNGSGLDMSQTLSGAYGSARDMALLSGALVNKAPEIAAATAKSKATAKSEGGTSYQVSNTDPLVNTIPNLLLSKTGFTDLAGGNLALVIDVGINHPVAIIILGSSKEARFTDGSALIASMFAHFAGVASL